MRTKTHRVTLRKSAAFNEPLAHVVGCVAPKGHDRQQCCRPSHGTPHYLSQQQESKMWNMVKLFAAALVIYMGVSISMNIGNAMMKASAYATATRQ